ncbi:MAG: methyl-accepting chemotaxis protein [Rubrivivax sp.]|nr:methyl-accepting chemotaxis protein [Rubrivivax sp.]
MSEFFRYHGIWSPGVRLFRAIGFRAKAFVISVMFTVPIAVLAYSFFGDKGASIEFSARERVGVAYLTEASPVVQALQAQRRWAAQAAAQGSEAPELATARAALDAALKKLAAAQAAHGAVLDTGGAHDTLLSRLKALPAPGAGVDKVLSGYGEAVAAALQLMTTATDNSNLTLDPDIDTYYLMDGGTGALPALIEATSRMRDTALAIAHGGTASAGMLKALHAQEAIADQLSDRWKAGVDKVLKVRPEVSGLLNFDATYQALHRFHEVSESSDAPAKVLVAADAALDGLDKAGSASLKRLDELLAARVGALTLHRNAVAVLLLLTLVAVAYLFVSFRKVLEGGLKEVAFHINAMREGDLTTQPRAWGADEAANLMHTLTDMQASLRRIVSQVRGASDGIVTASTQISSGALDLSGRTEQSAANLEETAASMEQIAATVRNNEGTVGEAAKLALTNADAAQRGGKIIGQVVATMQQINDSSARIGDIIGTIDGIAFQTNILALNAAVEAARAGEQGRGFAVVAAEVRALAQRSGEAAREIKTLIGASLEQVERGTLVVREAGATIDEIVGSAGRVRELLSEVSNGAREQTQGIAQSAQAVQDLDRVTQQNAALVEQTAAAAGSLKDQAVLLAGEVAQFRLPTA